MIRRHTPSLEVGTDGTLVECHHCLGSYPVSSLDSAQPHT